MKVGLIAGIILLVVGAFYTFLPQSVHISSGIDFGLVHGTHILIGIILLIVGIVLIMISRKNRK